MKKHILQMKSLNLILSDARYFSPSWVFACVNILTGTWILYLPFIKQKFDLNDGQIGFALFFTALGLLISIPFVPYINKKIGVGRSTKIGVIALAILFNLPLLVPTYVSLCVCLLIMGVFSGFTDISMNALVATIEKKENQNFMSAAHGFFSLGGFIGAGVGSLLMSQFSNPSFHMLGISVFIILTTIVLAKNYENIKNIPVQESIKKVSVFRYLKPLLVLSIIAFIIMFNEGAVEHWSTLFLFDVVQVSESKAGLGFIIFSLTMTIGRFLGDGVSYKIGAIKTIVFGSIVAFIAYMLIITANLYVSVLGFGLLGFGLSVIIPEIYRLAGKTKEIDTSLAISFVSGFGFVGFLIGPVLLGVISNWSTLTSSYLFLAALLVISFFLAFFGLKRKG
jgi:fucose permease